LNSTIRSSLLIKFPPSTAIHTFPYTTLFRSAARTGAWPDARAARRYPARTPTDCPSTTTSPTAPAFPDPSRSANATGLEKLGQRSEEHTSELQSRVDLVCRLLLE